MPGVDILSSLNTKEQSIGKGFVVLSAANIAVKVVSLLFVPFLNKILGGEAGYSVYYSANQVFAFVYVLTTAGLPVAISKLVTELTSTGNRKQAKQAFPDGTNADGAARRCSFRNYGDIREANRPLYE